jgi:uncharacterized protein (DUF433 family)
MLANEPKLVGIGLYTVPEAARLTGVAKPTIRRWLFGYRARRNGRYVESPPVWESQIARIDSVTGLGFLDLMEVRFVHAFREHGVSLNNIRLAVERACEIFGSDHPFAKKRFQTDGRRIFAAIAESTGETTLIDLVKSQYAFHRVVKPSLYASLEFSDADEVLRWFPLWPRQQVVVDPEKAFGRPIVSSGHVPTDTLAQAVEAEASMERVARSFDVPVQAVRAAVEFEKELAA